MNVRYEWNDKPMESVVVPDGYDPRSLYLKFLEQVPGPAAIGYIGGVNSDPCWLFGPGYRNRVIPLVDDRQPDELMSPAEDLEYLFFADHRSGAEEWAGRHGFHRIFRAESDSGFDFTAFQKNLVEKPR